jgi:hypothetical protein
VLTGVVDADWIPGTDTLAVIRDPGNNRPWTVEFPAGTTVHEAPAAWSLRVSPDGSRVAFFEGPLIGSAPQAMITVIDRSGRKSTVTRDWSGIGLAWAPSGTEVWFTASQLAPGEFAPSVHAVSLAGALRHVHHSPDWLVLHDISGDGRVLLSRNTIDMSIACRQQGDTSERNLRWLLAATARGLSPDGRTVVFEDELLSSPAGNPTIFSRTTDGSPAIQIGEGHGAALSPDGKWVLAQQGENLVLLPTGIGEMVTLSKGDVRQIGEHDRRDGSQPAPAHAAWLSDSKHIVFTGRSGSGTPRGYVQEIPAGLPRAVTPEGVALAGKAAVQDDGTVLGRVGAAWMLFPIHGGGGRPVAALKPEDMPLQWSHQGRYVYTVDIAQGARSAAVDVFRVEVATGSRTLWKTLAPSDPVGVEDMRETLVMTPDAQSYCYSSMQRLGGLFVVEGLK